MMGEARKTRPISVQRITFPSCPRTIGVLDDNTTAGVQNLILTGENGTAAVQQVTVTGTGTFTLTFNGESTPALPTGLNPAGLPTSIQIAAAPFAEARLFSAAHALEGALGVAASLSIDVKE